MPVTAWRHWSRRQRLQVALGVLVVLVVTVAAVGYALTADGLSFTEGVSPTAAYLLVFVLVAADAVIPIFPGETTLNAAATAAAQGVLELTPIIVMGALGTILGDPTLFWLARRNSHRIGPVLDKAKSNDKVRQALALMDSSAPALIVGGRYVPGMRFVVNATMGISEIRYARSCAGRRSVAPSGAPTRASWRTRSAWPSGSSRWRRSSSLGSSQLWRSRCSSCPCGVTPAPYLPLTLGAGTPPACPFSASATSLSRARAAFHAKSVIRHRHFGACMESAKPVDGGCVQRS